MTTPGHNRPTPPRDEADALDRLRALGGRVTRSRRDLIEFFYGNDHGVTADELVAEFPLHDPATVYRALSSLEAAGIVQHAHLGHAAATYRRAGAPTVQVVCEQCGRTTNIPRTEFKAVRSRIATKYGFTIDLQHFAITGRCKRCAAKKA
jgi:Fur family ferric uptake transcriptional regulator